MHEGRETKLRIRQALDHNSNPVSHSTSVHHLRRRIYKN
jgi:hypothetical protein